MMVILIIIITTTTTISRQDAMNFLLFRFFICQFLQILQLGLSRGRNQGASEGCWRVGS
jgi:hypothetical protein